MTRSRRLLAGALVLAACTKVAPPPPPPPPATCTEAAPCVLAPGTPARDRIAAGGEVDHYLLRVPAVTAGARTILHLELASLATVTPVRFVVVVLAPGGKSVVGTLGPAAQTASQRLSANLLVADAGDYPILVRDVQTTAADPHNEYLLTATLLADPDAGEPDDLPASARPMALGAAEVKAEGTIASRGDRDLLSFEVTGTGVLAFIGVHAAATGDTVRLRARILQRAAATPDDLAAATALAEVQASKAGAALEASLTRFLAAGRYLVEISDLAGTESDARPEAKWTVTLATVADPDPLEQASRNDTAQTATALVPGAAALHGAIGSQGDRDWYRVSVPACDTGQIVEVKLDPLQANGELRLLWAVGEKLREPAGACDASCGPATFCAGTKCAYKLRAMRGYAANDGVAQVVRLPHRGGASEVLVLVSDQGDDGRSARPYAVSAELFADPDPNELQASNDARANATVLSPTVDAAGTVRFKASGRISWWDYVDGRATYQQGADGDWYALDLPPRDPAPACGAGGTDGGCFDADAGTGPSLAVRPMYGLSMTWKGPPDGTYRIGLQGVVSVDATKTACRFSFDERYARLGADGTYAFGDEATDPCLCLPSAQAERDRLWLKVEAAHRPAPPQANRYSDEAYEFELRLSPGVLLPTCLSKCDAVKQASTCPGE